MSETGAGPWSRELEIARSMAVVAGHAVMAVRGTAEVMKKAHGEPVTAADLEANRIILERLAREFPDDAILSEETPSDPSRAQAKRIWIIDPIDGTREFIEGTEDFAIQIGLVENGEPVVGVVNQVAKGRLYTACKGGGAFLDGKDGAAPRRVATSTKTDPHEMAITVSRWHKSKKHGVIAGVVKPARTVPAGSIGVKMGLVATGEVDLYLHPSRYTAEWDTCAPHVILTEAGGMLTDFEGKPLRYNQPDPHHPRGIAATNGKVHAQILALLAPVLTELGF